MGPKHPPTANDTIPLGAGRIILGWLTLAFIIVGFTPTPFVTGDMRPEPQQQAAEPILVEANRRSLRPSIAAALPDVSVGIDTLRLGDVLGDDLPRVAHFAHRAEVARLVAELQMRR